MYSEQQKLLLTAIRNGFETAILVDGLVTGDSISVVAVGGCWWRGRWGALGICCGEGYLPIEIARKYLGILLGLFRRCIIEEDKPLSLPRETL